MASVPAVNATKRLPRPGDHVIVYGDRLTVLALRDRGRGPVVVTEDDAGMRIERPCDRLTWDPEVWAWR